MKSSALLYSICLIFPFAAQAAAPCGGSKVGFWTNPDGSRGGWVARTAKVQAGATIAPQAEVCEYAIVKKGTSVLDNAFVGGHSTIFSNAEISGKAKVLGDAKIGGGPAITKVSGDVVIEGSPTITGASNIFARAKISGGSKIHNAVICQASLISGFDVVDSDYYCQTEDPEPAHPGELGKKTLLGVDSDRDGVRDDLEIWINDKFSNMKDKDMYNYRMVYKQIATGEQKAYKFKDDKEKAVAAMREVFDAQRCTSSIRRSNTKDDLKAYKEGKAIRDDTDEMYLVTNNNKERIKAELQIRQYFHGSFLNGLNKTSDGCYFQKK